MNTIKGVRPLMTVREVAAVLGTSPGAIKKTRCTNPNHPLYSRAAVRVGARVMYDPADVEHYIHTRKGASV